MLDRTQRNQQMTQAMKVLSEEPIFPLDFGYFVGAHVADLQGPDGIRAGRLEHVERSILGVALDGARPSSLAAHSAQRYCIARRDEPWRSTTLT